MASAKMQVLANSIYFLPFYDRKITKCQGEMENINVVVSMPKTQKTTRKRMRSNKKLGLAFHLFAETARKFGCSKSTKHVIYKNIKLTRPTKIQRMVGQDRQTTVGSNGVDNLELCAKSINAEYFFQLFVESPQASTETSNDYLQ